MHQVLFYPVGNGDTSQIILENGKRILFDFRHLKKAEDEKEPHIDLNARLKEELKKVHRTSFDVVAFTHGDNDHIANSTEFFELLHAAKYQGEGRIKIDELWVPAAMILETAANDDQSSEFVIWRQEARHRLREGKAIRVFSKPEMLKDWLEDNGLTVESRMDFIVDAGQVVPGFTLDNDGVEFFCHSPFVKHVDEGDDLRNEAALIFNVRFKAGNQTFDYLAVGDSTWEVMEDIVRTTKAHGREDRLKWDLYNIPHHCSYRALSDTKGETETAPATLVEELLLLGKAGAYLVSSSHRIPDIGNSEDGQLPPHVEAKRCYKKYLAKVGGTKFLVTMEESGSGKPEPLTFKIEPTGVSRVRTVVTGAAAIISNPTPKAG
jgi:hypothetical protein